MIPTRTFDYLEILKTSFRKDDIFAKVVNGNWVKYSVDDYIEASWNVASGLLEKGYKPEDKVAVVCNNCPEWNFLDMGCALARLIMVPVYQTLSADEFLHVFNHSDSSLIIAGNKVLYDKLKPIVQRMEQPAEMMTIENCGCGFCFDDLIELGKRNREKFNIRISDNIRDISPDEVATIIYTSGTTGASKGVMLTHHNLTFDSRAHALLQTANSTHKMLSFLPICHAYERTMNYEFQQLGISIYYAESMQTIQRDHASFHGDGFCAVPRVLEMMYTKLEAAGNNLKGIKRRLYKLAWKFGNNYDNSRKDWWYQIRHRLADKLVFSKWRDAFGGHELWVVTGGASIRPNIIRLFTAAKLHLYQGYGMTETSPVISVNPPANNQLGTNGPPLAGTEMRFAGDGEILVRGPHVMKGYYKDEQATREIIDADGWLHTGDIGYLKDGKYLMITDRKKEIFKLSSGKYIAPQVLENKLRESSFFENIFVFGENQNFASAVILPKFDAIRHWCSRKSISTALGDEELLANPHVVDMLNKEVGKVNKNLADFERIRKWMFSTDTWTIDNGMLSQTLKPKRAVFLERYKDFANEVYK